MKTLAIACFALLTTVVSAQNKKSDVDPIFSDSVIQSWGYRSIKCERREQSEWEIRHFGRAGIRLQWIKGTDQIKDWKNAYYRFLIAEETYGGPEDAKKRIEWIRDTPPGLDTKADPHWVLCDGIAVGKIAYIVSTDSVKFQMEALPSVMRLLAAKVANK